MHRKVQLIVSGGIRNGADVAKCLALGADAVSIGTAALIALGDNDPNLEDEYRKLGTTAGAYDDWHEGRDPAGITTQDPELAKRLDPVLAGKRLANYLSVLTLEAQTIARACGKSHVHNLEPEDLVALTIEVGRHGRRAAGGYGLDTGQGRDVMVGDLQRGAVTLRLPLEGGGWSATDLARPAPRSHQTPTGELSAMALLVGVTGPQSSPDRVRHTSKVCEHIGRRDTQDTVAFACKPAIPERIPSDLIVLRMLAAIDLDHQTALETDEIHNVSANRMLPTKARAVDPAAAERAATADVRHRSCCCAAVARVR